MPGNYPKKVSYFEIILCKKIVTKSSNVKPYIKKTVQRVPYTLHLRTEFFELCIFIIFHWIKEKADTSRP